MCKNPKADIKAGRSLVDYVDNVEDMAIKG
jgi:hypothetical protein